MFTGQAWCTCIDATKFIELLAKGTKFSIFAVIIWLASLSGHAENPVF